MMGLLIEQGGGQLVSNNVYNAISNIESVYSYADQSGDVIGKSYKGNEKESNILSAISSTIGLNYWSKIGDFLRGQIYSFMFQSDSGSKSRLRWLAGLAQAVDSSINRGNIIDKPIDDPNVQNAIKLIQQSISQGTIDNLYGNYVGILKDQYSKISGTPNDSANRLKIWGPRPEALDKLMRGESWDNVKVWWEQQIGGQSQQGNQQQNSGVNITSNDLGQFIKDIQTKSKGTSIDVNNVQVILDTKTNNYSLKIGSGKTQINYLRLALNVRADKSSGTFPSKDKILNDFPGSKSIKDGTFDGGTRDYSIIMIP